MENYSSCKEDDHDEDIVIIMKDWDHGGELRALKQKDPDQVHKTLGYKLIIGQDNTAVVKVSVNKARKCNVTLLNYHLSPRQKLMTYSRCVVPTICNVSLSIDHTVAYRFRIYPTATWKMIYNLNQIH